MRNASSRGGTGSSGYTRSARSQSRSLPCRPDVATSPRAAITSSIWFTFRWFVQPDERHGTTHVSGSSPATSGPSTSRRARMSRRHASLAMTQSCTERCQPTSRSTSRRAAISARNSATSSAGRIIRLTSTRARPDSAAASSSGANPDPRRLHSTSSALRATAVVGSFCSSPRRWTVPIRSRGRSAVSSCARTAIRRAWRRVSWRTSSTRRAIEPTLRRRAARPGRGRRRSASIWRFEVANEQIGHRAKSWRSAGQYSRPK